MVPPVAASGVLLTAGESFEGPTRRVRYLPCRGGAMPESNSGRKKTYMIIIVILLVILAVTLI